MLTTLFGKPPEPEPTKQKSGLLERMKQAVTRTRDGLQERMDDLLALTRPVDAEALEQLESTLIASDIGVNTAAEIIEHLQVRAARQQIRDGAELKNLLKDEIQQILDVVQTPLAAVTAKPEVIFMVGVNGTGKTTTTGKLAAYFREQHKSVLLCAADTFRAAAIEQLEVWSQRAGVEMIRTRQGGDPSAALFDTLQAAKARSVDVVLVDTAGRLHTKNNLMAELEKMRRTAQRFAADAPHQTLLVMDATTGQNGLQQARLFTESSAVNGIVLTKLDGTAKGGIVVAIAQELQLPVRYVGIGEQMADLIPFDTSAFVDSLLDR
ncbi:MAG TPA: signal recognition particle-docking protein FtsY [Acidobacteriaceae bacterium]|jgi:fused signal recognition particle receptor|nr:signal recognition particle-docking protein FtsY [Acidobacteriaceae bacterium]